ncbi:MULTISPECIES: ATP-binding protein [Thermomonosporaceae]|uniref:ATP-binding protein n=1 Tax=Thermomonosporaceae TaxID=2012 RepID=UPI00255ACC38|nr:MULTISPECIES: ATP-binding protein [Thermomonosporaceae]MDL4777537.1 ATP-binding protein [Actinomadura xylanilytica]
MKVAFVGKGGSGKTTLASLFVRHLAARGLPVAAIDADINQHLAVALGLDEERAAKIPALGERLPELKDWLRGANPRIASASAMVKTTPPGDGSRLLGLGGDDPFHALGQEVDGVTLLATGPFSDDDLGVSCYHAKTGAVELYLNHLVDGPGEYVVADMTAGADSFASGLFTRFDLMFLVAEPTRKGVGVYRQYTEYARDYGVAIAVVGNKVQDDDDLAYLRAHVGDDLLTWLGQSAAVRALEQGRDDVVLEDAERAALDLMRDAVDARRKDWERFRAQGVEFHLRNARSRTDPALRAELEEQVDPGFRYPV